MFVLWAMQRTMQQRWVGLFLEVSARDVKMTRVTTTITDMLHRRNDLSTFLVHFTRPTADGTNGFDALKSIVTQNVIEARTAYGAATNACGAVRRGHGRSRPFPRLTSSQSVVNRCR
jgi:hypothetical protein